MFKVCTYICKFILGPSAPIDINLQFWHVGHRLIENANFNTSIQKYFNAVSRAQRRSYPSLAFRHPYQSRPMQS